MTITETAPESSAAETVGNPLEPFRFPVTEIFTAPQGEGIWTGALMTFVRLAGCSVGRPYQPQTREMLGLAVYQERCHDWAGNGFPCDTNYRQTRRMSVEEILAHAEVQDAQRICLTGGEPLMHQRVSQLILRLTSAGKKVHVETSGTIEPGTWANHSAVWLTVSPKRGCLAASLYAAKEIKVLVDEVFEEGVFQHKFGHMLEKIILMPVNGLSVICWDNMARCLELQSRYPSVRVGIQMQKVWHTR